MNKKKLFINTIAQLLGFSSSLIIGLVVSPYIVSQFNEGAYSYIGIANDFANYITIITAAINSMAARFISVELHKGNKKMASVYFSSVFIADLILSLVAMVFGLIITFNVENIFKAITPNIITDVKITFALVFLNMIINLITSIFSIAPFVTDNLEKSAIRGIFANLIRVAVLIVLFAFFPARIYFVTLGIMGTTVFYVITNFMLKKQLMPDIVVRAEDFKWSAIKTLLASGIWSSIGKLSSVLLTGLSAVITSIAIGEHEAGLLALARTIPVNIYTLISTLATMFTPQFIILYAKGDIKGLLKNANYTMKILPLMLIVPIAGYMGFGYSFFELWQYSSAPADLQVMQVLSIFSMGTNLMCIFVYPLTSINTTTNKVKWPVIATFITGVLSLSTTLILLKVTNIGVYAVNLISTIFSMLRLMFFVPMYASHNLKLKLSTFYPVILRGLATFGVVQVFFIVLHSVMRPYINNWLTLSVAAIIAAVPGYLIVYILLLNKSEKEKVRNMIMNKLKRKNK